MVLEALKALTARLYFACGQVASFVHGKVHARKSMQWITCHFSIYIIS